MNYALIFAGGVGKRMNSRALPKQFLEIHGKPIIIHTIENFSNHPEIDAICLVCVADWMEHMQELLNRFHIKKVKWLVPGGETALESQYLGLCAIQNSEQYNGGDIVLIHDGVRPLIDRKLIHDCIDGVNMYGSAITVAPAVETIILSDEKGEISDTVERDKCKLARAPQSFRIGDILKAHEQARNEAEGPFIDSTSLMLHYGYPLHTVEGPAENIKVTNPADFFICRALLDAIENSQIFGI